MHSKHLSLHSVTSHESYRTRAEKRGEQAATVLDPPRSRNTHAPGQNKDGHLLEVSLTP